MPTRTILTILTLLTAVGSFVNAPREAAAAEQVTVRLESGRSFTAAVDRRTNDSQLWLRFDGPTAHILRAFPWGSIARVTHGENSYTAEEFQARAAELAGDYEPAELIPPPTPEGNPEPPQPEIGPIAALDIDAWLDNWDADLETDGLTLTLYPRDARGLPAGFRGHVEVDLNVFERNSFSAIPHGRGKAISKIGRWSFPVEARAGDHRGVEVRCPFQAKHPEFTYDLNPHGLMHLRLSVPGVGVFERSLDGVRIRPFAPLRDTLERDTGYRFLSQEHTGRGKSYFGP